MVKLLFIFLFLLCLGYSITANAQDVIHRSNGEVLKVQIIATSKTDITYSTKTKSNTDTIITIERSDVTSYRRASENMEIAQPKE